jgi:hypothetical protein
MIEIVVKTENPPNIEGINWVVLKNHSYAEISEPLQIKINDSFYRLHLTENGGGMSNTGVAEIICNLDGEPLKPVQIRKKGNIANGTHAIFVGKDLIMITAKHHRSDFVIKIEKHSINDMSGRTTIEDIWFGNIFIGKSFDVKNILPEKFKKFENPVICAIDKAMCYHCKCIHYAIHEHIDEWSWVL